MELHGSYVRLRPVAARDATRLREVLADPTVARWWGDPDEELAGVLEPDEDTASFVIEYADNVVGLIQYSEEPTPGYRHAGIDIAVHSDWHGRGVGTDAIHTLARYLLDVRGHHRLTIDPAADNASAIRVYKRLGFRPVGLLRQYERAPEGHWRDGLLLDLLATELRPVARS
ncbi:GNAT family N-acetyltransferase [Tamaricihabitans halophyticus]|uniref:GNAT family N-acetyltransferase n=1 Tax=Tamaricihabitans halophyticus TaxID=1262583 RepID=UPI003C73EB00